MRLGMVGLGRMGANMARRLIRGGHEVVVTDLTPEAVKQMATEGAIPSSSLDDFTSKLGSPRIAWLMVPAGGPTESTAQALAQRMKTGDILIDGGNSYFKDDIRRSKLFGEKGIHYVDVGTSDGVIAFTHLWWSADGPAEDPLATDSSALHTNRLRVLQLATQIVPGHGAPFTPNEKTPR